MSPLLDAFGLFLIAVTLLPMTRSGRWWIRSWDFPRVQIAVCIAAVVVVRVVFFGLQGWYGSLLIAALMLALAYQLVQILPYTPLHRVQAPAAPATPPERRIRILVANVLQHNRNADALLAVVEKERPDLFLALETSSRWERQLAPLEATFVRAFHQPQDNTYGLLFYAMPELRETTIRFLVEKDVPSVRAEVRLGSGDWFVFYGVHPRPPQPAQDTHERDAELLIIGREAHAEPLPAIVAGDLNDVAWSHTTRMFQRISGLLDPRIGRGLLSTFHARYPLLRWPLDHLFHDPAFALVEMRRLPDIGSDHFPFLVELAFVPSMVSPDAPRPMPGERREAIRRILKGLPGAARHRLDRILHRERRIRRQGRRRR